jgi:hypothetical protein
MIPTRRLTACFAFAIQTGASPRTLAWVVLVAAALLHSSAQADEPETVNQKTVNQKTVNQKTTKRQATKS